MNGKPDTELHALLWSRQKKPFRDTIQHAMFANTESQGLFQCSKRHHKLNNVMTHSEATHARSFEDNKKLHKITVGQKYLSEQIFSADEASLL